MIESGMASFIFAQVRSSRSFAMSGRCSKRLATHSSRIFSVHRARHRSAIPTRINVSRNGAGYRTQASYTTTRLLILPVSVPHIKVLSIFLELSHDFHGPLPLPFLVGL